MATATKNIKKNPPQTPVAKPDPALALERKRQIRLGIGAFFALSGVITFISIISYYFTWSSDQDQLISSGSLISYLFHDSNPVANWCGRFGATVAHILVFKGAGVASLAVAFGITAIGLNILYGKKVLPLLAYFRWISIFLLITAPILSYLFPHSRYSYPLGGALGDVSIDYFNGLIGKTGTGLLLLSVFLFFLLVIIALDVSPLIARIRARAEKLRASLAASSQFEPPSQHAEQTEQPVSAPIAPKPFALVDDEENLSDDDYDSGVAKGAIGNRLHAEPDSLNLVIEDRRGGKALDMNVVEKKQAEVPAGGHFAIMPDEENPGQLLADDDYEEEEETN